MGAKQSAPVSRDGPSGQSQRAAKVACCCGCCAVCVGSALIMKAVDVAASHSAVDDFVRKAVQEANHQLFFIERLMGVVATYVYYLFLGAACAVLFTINFGEEQLIKHEAKVAGNYSAYAEIAHFNPTCACANPSTRYDAFTMFTPNVEDVCSRARDQGSVCLDTPACAGGDGAFILQLVSQFCSVADSFRTTEIESRRSKALFSLNLLDPISVQMLADEEASAMAKRIRADVNSPLVSRRVFDYSERPISAAGLFGLRPSTVRASFTLKDSPATTRDVQYKAVDRCNGLESRYFTLKLDLTSNSSLSSSNQGVKEAFDCGVAPACYLTPTYTVSATSAPYSGVYYCESRLCRETKQAACDSKPLCQWSKVSGGVTGKSDDNRCMEKHCALLDLTACGDNPKCSIQKVDALGTRACQTRGFTCTQFTSENDCQDSSLLCAWADAGSTLGGPTGRCLFNHMMTSAAGLGISEANTNAVTEWLTQVLDASSSKIYRRAEKGLKASLADLTPVSTEVPLLGPMPHGSFARASSWDAVAGSDTCDCLRNALCSRTYSQVVRTGKTISWTVYCNTYDTYLKTPMSLYGDQDYWFMQTKLPEPLVRASSFDSLEQAMVNAFMTGVDATTDHKAYFKSCAPSLCTYFTYEMPTASQYVTIILSLLGGLTVTMRGISILVVGQSRKLFKVKTAAEKAMEEEKAAKAARAKAGKEDATGEGKHEESGVAGPAHS